MKIEKMITLSKGGTKERNVPINQVEIPDLWHIAQVIKTSKDFRSGEETADLILKCWYLAHDLRKHIQESEF